MRDFLVRRDDFFLFFFFLSFFRWNGALGNTSFFYRYAILVCKWTNGAWPERFFLSFWTARFTRFSSLFFFFFFLPVNQRVERGWKGKTWKKHKTHTHKRHRRFLSLSLLKIQKWILRMSNVERKFIAISLDLSRIRICYARLFLTFFACIFSN